MSNQNASRAKLSTDLLDIDTELELIEAEMRNLRKRKQSLVEKKSQILRRIECSSENNGDSEDRWDNDNYPWSQDANRLLKEVFNLDSFRPLQRAAVNSVMSKEDALVIMSTGGGKSLCYQLPAVLSKGLTLVVSPLISLVEDQLAQLRKLGIEAATLNQSTAKEEVKRIETAITNKESNFRLLYVTPEKLAKSKRIMNKLEKSVEVGFLNLIAIDEVHCCSQWGHDFRPDYKFLNILKRQFKGVPLLGLTATATQRVLDDLKEMLGIPAAIVFRAGFNRPNLVYEVKDKSSTESITDIATEIKTRFPSQSGIVYCFSRKDCEEVTKKLREQKVRAAFYHAYLEPHSRTAVHEKWLEGSIQVIVATVAFGMGIDKPDVRFVIHYAIPKSIDNYYQESGRAGRDGAPATCILYFRLADVFRQSTMICSERTGIANLYSMVEFALDRSVCRRSRLAEHFEESWEPEWCLGSCDVCKNGLKTRQLDVSSQMRSAVAIIEEQAKNPSKEGSGQITGGKLVDLLKKRGSRGDANDMLESIVGHLVIEGYLQEKFHFTPYSVISYMEVGSKWRLNTGAEIMMEVPSDEKRSDDSGSTVKRKKRKLAEPANEVHDDDDEVVMLD